jgi:hypothetical protein
MPRLPKVLSMGNADLLRFRDWCLRTLATVNCMTPVSRLKELKKELRGCRIHSGWMATRKPW